MTAAGAAGVPVSTYDTLPHDPIPGTSSRVMNSTGPAGATVKLLPNPFGRETGPIGTLHNGWRPAGVSAHVLHVPGALSLPPARHFARTGLTPFEV